MWRLSTVDTRLRAHANRGLAACCTGPAPAVLCHALVSHDSWLTARGGHHNSVMMHDKSVSAVVYAHRVLPIKCDRSERMVWKNTPRTLEA